MDVDSKETIKTYLKINSPNFEDKSYYSINKTKNIITLYDPVDKEPSDKSSDFEEDKIFDENDNNSYIYEEICQNTINNTLKGTSYSFITYGDSNSNKIKLLIGDIENNNLSIYNIGLFPKLLDNLLKKQKSLKNTSENIDLKISYFLVHDSDMFDLSNLKNKSNINESKLYENKHTIKKEENISNIIKKESVENLKEEINFLNKVFNLLIKLEEKEESKNIFTRSHICIIIYITNVLNNSISIINFIILNGSEYLYSGKTKNFKSLMNNDNNKKVSKNTIEGTKIALETQYTYESIFNLVKLKIFIDNNIDSSNTNEINLILKKNKQNSKLTTVLFNIFFNMKKTKFRIIGTVSPNIGVYQNFKDTLIFLFDFYKIKKNQKKKSNTNINDNSTSLKHNDNKFQLTQKRNPNQVYTNAQKDNLIFELENKVNTYKKIIEEHKTNLAKKDEKITLLEQTYQEQVNILKKKFNFTGDINILISGDENTKEAEFIRNLKEASENNIRNEGNLRLLQKKLDNAEEEIKKLKNKEQLIDGNDTMIKYYISVQQKNEEKNRNDKEINNLRIQIEELKEQLLLKDKLIENYKKDIINKSNILFNLPKTLKESYTYKVTDENKNKDHENNLGEQNIEEENNNTNENESLRSDNLYKSEMQRIKNENQKKLDILKLNYENAIKEKNSLIKTLEFKYETLQADKNIDINKYGKEIVKLNKILMSLISNYKRIFSSTLTKKCSIINFTIKKEEFDKIIMNADQDINCNNFPLLYQTLLKTKQLKMNQPLLHTNLKKKYLQLSNSEKKAEEKTKVEKEKESNLNSAYPIKNEQLSKFFKEETNNGKIIFSKEKLETMSKEAIIIHCININNKLMGIEKYLEKYIQYKKGFNVEEFEKGEKYKDEIIDDLKNKLNKLSVNLDEQIKVNNQKICVINSQNRKIDKLEKDSIIYNNILRYKKPNSSISLLSPNKSTIYNSSAIEFNSINSNNSLNKKNINNKSLKKSNSYLYVNNSRQIRSQRKIKAPGNNSATVFPRPLSPKIKDFTIEKLKSKLYMFQPDK